jgi:hypothetical protein
MQKEVRICISISEVMIGLQAVYDYGQVVELKKRTYVVLVASDDAATGYRQVDAAIFMHPRPGFWSRGCV